jgi:hypothetical protein
MPDNSNSNSNYVCVLELAPNIRFTSFDPSSYTEITVNATSLTTATNGITQSADTDIPDAFLCPITYEIMINPVICADGHTYEETAIRAWLAIKNTSPKTNLPLRSRDVTPNYALKTAIADWRQRQIRRS